MVAISRNRVLIDATSIAIWNGNKVVVTLVITVWVTSIGFHVQSKSLPLTVLQNIWNPVQTWFGNRSNTGEWPISIIFGLLGLSHL